MRLTIDQLTVLASVKDSIMELEDRLNDSGLSFNSVSFETAVGDPAGEITHDGDDWVYLSNDE